MNLKHTETIGERALLRVVVAEDEPVAAESMVRELTALGCQVVAVADNGERALTACLAHRPHCCVSDVAMPVRDGLALARALRIAAPEVRVIFVTAHPGFAVDAFAEEVIDFVPKPVRRPRLAEALDRVRRAVAVGFVEPRLVVGERGALHLLAVRDLEWVQADGATLWLHTAHRAWARRERMQRLEQELAPHGFLRVHRSALVRLGAVISLVLGEDREHLVQLRSGVHVRVARDRVTVVREALAAMAVVTTGAAATAAEHRSPRVKQSI
jgi:two-component system LytT family response regulator